MKYPVRIVPAVLCLFLFLTFPSCGEKPGEKRRLRIPPRLRPNPTAGGTGQSPKAKPNRKPNLPQRRIG